MSNTKTAIVTTFNQRLYDAYAKDFLNTLETECDVYVYSEESIPETNTTLLHKQADFVERNKHRPTRNFKYDAVRFCYKPYAIAQCLEDYGHRHERILWIDADTHFLKPITDAWIDQHLHKEDTIMTYMGRPNYHSECGVLLFNLQHTRTWDFVKTVERIYNTDEVYMLKEWHDSYVWDYVRELYEQQGELFHDVGVKHKVPGGHIQAHLFGEWFDHKKGPRKKAKKSQENRFS